MTAVNDRPEWMALQAHWKETADLHMRELFAADPEAREPKPRIFVVGLAACSLGIKSTTPRIGRCYTWPCVTVVIVPFWWTIGT